jgi:hypothetical protein
MNLDEMDKEEVQKIVRQKLVGHDELRNSHGRRSYLSKRSSHTSIGASSICLLPDGGQLEKLVCEENYVRFI